MISTKAKLSIKVFSNKIEHKAIRDGIGEGLILAGEKEDRVVVLTADLKDSTKVDGYAKKFPSRFFDVGVAEQALVTVASGMASYGKIPFITSFSVFSPGRNWEQIRTTVCLNNVPVKIIGSHSGFSAVLDGGSHQMLEDISLMRVLPNMVVYTPSDAIEAKKAVLEALGNGKPTYIRSFREPTPIFTTEASSYKTGSAEVLWETKNPEVAIVGCGPLVYEALLAAKGLEKKGMGSIVVNCGSVKPFDDQTVIHAAKLAGAVVTIEEHQIAGGLGSVVSELLSKNFPVPMEFVGVRDSFGESGKYNELLKKYDLTSEEISSAAKKVIGRKNS